MAHRSLVIKNETLAHTLVKESLNKTSGLFIFIGKPILRLTILILEKLYLTKKQLASINKKTTNNHNLFEIKSLISKSSLFLLTKKFKKIKYKKSFNKSKKQFYLIKSAIGKAIDSKIKIFSKFVKIYQKQLLKLFRSKTLQTKNNLKNLLKNYKNKYSKHGVLQRKKTSGKKDAYYLKGRGWIKNLFLTEKTSFNEKVKQGEIFILKSKLFFYRLLKFPRFVLRKSVKLVITFFVINIFLLIVCTGLWFYFTNGLPSPKTLSSREMNVSTKIYDRNGLLLYKIYKDENRTPVELNDIPKNVIDATLAIEDSEFYSHPGFSIRGIVRALKKNVDEGKLVGGSTITQQLVKNVFLSSEKTLTRKIKELILAVGVELTYSKDEILEMYLSEVSYGGTAYGIQEASQMYFDKDVKDLDLAESALLAAIPKSPTHFSPFANVSASISRQKEVLKLMRINGYITESQERIAVQETLKFAENKTDIKAPHFVMYVKDELEKIYGKEMVEKGGLEVKTTLDYRIQLLAEEVVTKEVDKLSKLNVSNAAVVIMDPETGEILAMVGSKNYFDTKNDGNVNVTVSQRQPGSSIKVVNYAYALSHGYTPASIIADTPISFKVQGQPPYSPKNYDGQYRGNITLRSALAESRNIPAVKVLASYGLANMLDMGRRMGITTWTDPSRFGLSLTLGGGEVKLTDLTVVYSTIANYGKKPNPTSIISVKNYKGKTISDSPCKFYKTENTERQSPLTPTLQIKENKNCNEKVLDERVAYQLIDILKDNKARSPSFGSNSMLVIADHPEVAVKTGTSNDLKDNLTVGFTQKYVVAVWVGNNDNSPMSRIASGVTGAAPIFNKIMSTLLKDEPAAQWIPPSGLSQIAVCSFTGTLPCNGCPTRIEWFLEGTEPQTACRLDEQKIAEENEIEDKKQQKPRERRFF